MTRPDRLLPGLLLTAITLLSFLVFPGHAYLTSDTQIYAPIFENLRNSSVLSKDLLTAYPHVRFTLYDEITNSLRALGLPLQGALVLQQVLFRFLGFAGAFLIARRAGLSEVPAGFATATFALGAFVAGPAIFTIEVEPVPRGFAISLLIFAIGLIGYDRWMPALICAALAFLYHPPVALPVWLVILGLATYDRARLRATLATIAAAVAVLGLAALLQAGPHTAQHLFSQIPPALEKLQRMRASYNWLALWPKHFYWQYPLLTLLTIAAWLRLRATLPRTLQTFLLALPLIGLLCIPLSYLLLDVGKWSLMPQFQPARAVLFCTAWVMLFGTIAAIRAVQARRYWEAPLWLVVIYALPLNTDLLEYFSAFEFIHIRQRVALAVGLALLSTLTIFLATRWKWIGCVACLATATFAFWVPPVYGRVRNYPLLDTPALTALSDWARQSAPADAVFLFPKARENQTPGVFRERALRAVYTDWKSGGQVNFSEEFAYEWWKRWQDVMASGALRPLTHYRDLGITHLVVPSDTAVPDAGAPPLFRNDKFAVYAVKY